MTLLPENLLQKKRDLERGLADLDGLLVAYSGGVDSAYLAYAAYQVLGVRMLAVLADSPSLSRAHFEDAVRFAKEHEIPLKIISTEEMANIEYVRNDASRCFHCKDELFRVMESVQQQLRFPYLAYGMNTDDLGDFRPGQKAATRHGVLAPLLDAGLGKQDVRELSRQAGLRVWNKPASACLSSRIEYGRPVTAEALNMVERAESAVGALGFSQFRVRYHGDLARVEIARDELPRAFTLRVMDEITRGVLNAGFKEVTIDPQGYRSGSMNSLLSIESIEAARAS